MCVRFTVSVRGWGEKQRGEQDSRDSAAGVFVGMYVVFFQACACICVLVRMCVCVCARARECEGVCRHGDGGGRADYI